MVSLNMLHKLDLRVSVVTRFVNSSVIIFILYENNLTFNFCLNCHSVLWLYLLGHFNVWKKTVSKPLRVTLSVVVMMFLVLVLVNCQTAEKKPQSTCGLYLVIQIDTFWLDLLCFWIITFWLTSSFVSFPQC